MTTPATAKSPPIRPPEPDDGVDYPHAPGALPIKSMFQFVPQAYMQSALETWLDDPTTLIASNMFIYYEPGNTRASVAPDVYIIPNVGSALRRSYFLWLEHEIPTFAMEIASSSTYRNDGGFKYRLYESWGVQEYWRYDPEGGLFTPLLQGYRLVDGQYAPIAITVDAEGGGCQGFSPLLGLELYARVGWFRFLDPATGQFLPNRQELVRERQELVREHQELAQDRDAERAARIAAEARIRQLEAQLENRQDS